METTPVVAAVDDAGYFADVAVQAVRFRHVLALDRLFQLRTQAVALIHQLVQFAVAERVPAHVHRLAVHAADDGHQFFAERIITGGTADQPRTFVLFVRRAADRAAAALPDPGERGVFRRRAEARIAFAAEQGLRPVRPRYGIDPFVFFTVGTKHALSSPAKDVPFMSSLYPGYARV